MALIEQRLPLKDKESWVPKNADVLAGIHGYVNNQAFQKALGEFIEQLVRNASKTDSLPPVAFGYFRWRANPPLTPAPRE